MTLRCEYRYVSTEARAEYLKANAPERVYNAYMKLTDGAAQADLWRLAVIYAEGGVYMDIDATLVWPLEGILDDSSEAFYIKMRGNTHYTNYFLAAAPQQPAYARAIDIIIHNIENRDEALGIYDTTGPTVLNQALEGLDVEFRDRKLVCIQGTFTNEYFQYLDRPRGKWIHSQPEDLIKK